MERRLQDETRYKNFCYSKVVYELSDELGAVEKQKIGDDGEIVVECDTEVAFRSPLILFDLFRDSMMLPDEIEDMSTY